MAEVSFKDGWILSLKCENCGETTEISSPKDKIWTEYRIVKNADGTMEQVKETFFKCKNCGAVSWVGLPDSLKEEIQVKEKFRLFGRRK